jgi:hypothetical protein
MDGITTAGPRTIPTIPSGKSYPFSDFQDDPRFPHVRSIRTKIRGVTKRNIDGADRQRIIRKWCDSGDALYLAREPNNPRDRNAIRVLRVVCADVADKPTVGEQLGYLSRELAEELAPRMDEHVLVLLAKILNVTGRERGHALGVNIQIEEYECAPQDHPASRV